MRDAGLGRGGLELATPRLLSLRRGRTPLACGAARGPVWFGSQASPGRPAYTRARAASSRSEPARRPRLSAPSRRSTWRKENQARTHVFPASPARETRPPVYEHTFDDV